MRRLADLALLLLQWALVALGFVQVFVGALSYRQNVAVRAAIEASRDVAEAAPLDTYYLAPSPLRFLLTSLSVGLIAMGLGAALFYLRRRHLQPRY